MGSEKELARQRRAERRQQQAKFLPQDDGTALEHLSISASTPARYREMWGDILRFAEGLMLPLDESSADDILAEWTSERYLEWMNASLGNYGIASLKFHMPAFSREGTLELPRSVMALRG